MKKKRTWGPDPEQVRRHLPDALILVALCGDHNVGLVQHEHGDLLQIEELELEAPVQRLPRRSCSSMYE